MFNPEKILGGLISSGLGRGKASGLIPGGMAMGLLGVAMEAAEHFLNQPKSASIAPSPPTGAGPPPPPGSGRQPPPPPQPQGKTIARETPLAAPQQEAVLLIRAMIAAANADGHIDAQERAAILERLKTASLSPAEHQFIVHELLEPKNMDQIVAAATHPELAARVYTASVFAINVDTQTERDYLRTLALRLGLDSAATDAIDRQCGRIPQ